MLELFPGASPFSCHIVVQDRVDSGTPTRGGHVLQFFSCTASSHDEPHRCSIYILLKTSFKSLSLLPWLRAQAPPVPTHQSSILGRVQKIQAHAAPVLNIDFPAAPQCQWPATHLPRQRPCSSSGAWCFEGNAKSYSVAYKMVWSRRGKRYFFFLSLFIGMLSIFNQVIEIVCNQKSIQPEKM